MYDCWYNKLGNCMEDNHMIIGELKSKVLATSPFDSFDLLSLFGDKDSAVIAVVNVYHNSVIAA